MSIKTDLAKRKLAEECQGKEYLIPFEEYLTEIHTVKMKIKLDLIQDNCCFGFQDCADGIIALAWENIDGYDEYPEERGRLFFRFGETFNEVENKLAMKNILMIN